jgi:uncharacterized membrane protein YhiD involved in acid resistance
MDLSENPFINYGGVMFRLGIAVGMGGLVGLQRELEGHPAGILLAFVRLLVKVL